VFEWILARYEVSLSWALRHSRFMMLIMFATIGLNFYLFAIVPKGFFPQQDTGRLNGSIQAAQDISFTAMRQKLADLVDIVRQDPAVESVLGFTGGGFGGTAIPGACSPRSAAGRAQNKRSGDCAAARKLSGAGCDLYLQAVQDVRIGGRQSNAQYQFTRPESAGAHLWAPRILQRLRSLPELVDSIAISSTRE
jgi:multidrug efflux pump